jgi:hypothetical protein
MPKFFSFATGRSQTTLFDETLSRLRAPNQVMVDGAAGQEDEGLQFFRQLCERCREQYGEAHQQTHLLMDLISRLESPPPNLASGAGG